MLYKKLISSDDLTNSSEGVHDRMKLTAGMLALGLNISWIGGLVQ